MGTSVSRTQSSTWLVAPPDPSADVGATLADLLGAIDDTRAGMLVGELVARTTEAARRATATGGDLATVLVAAVLDALTAAASTPVPPRGHDDVGSCLTPSLRRHIVDGAVRSASPVLAGEWVPRLVGAVEGIVEQCGSDPESTALMTAAMALIDIGGGLDRRFSCEAHGADLVAALDSGAGEAASCEALGGVRALVAANAAFERGIDLDAAGRQEAALESLCAARHLFLEAGLRVEAAVAATEAARIEADTDPEAAHSRYTGARAVLAEFGRTVEVARADRDLAFVVAARQGNAHASTLVQSATAVLTSHGLGEDAVLCEIVLASLAREAGRPRQVADHLAAAAGHLDSLGLTDRADAIRGLGR